MAITTNCFLNLSPPAPRSGNSSSSSSSSSSSPSTTSRTIQVPWKRNEVQSGRQSGAARVAVMVIGLVEVGSSFLGVGEISEAMAGETLDMAAQQKDKVARVARWSEERSCPPWRLNSLETIVPENLPRPHGNRKSESIGFSDHQDAPTLKARVARSNPRCFSM